MDTSTYGEGEAYKGTNWNIEPFRPKPKREQFEIVVENHNGQYFTRRYYTESVEQALRIAASEAYPFGFKDATYLIKYTMVDKPDCHVTFWKDFSQFDA